MAKRYNATRYGYAFLHQPYPYEFEPGESHFDHRAHQVDLIGHFLTEPPNRAAQMLIGYTLADIWLGETKRVANTFDEPQVMALGMASNIPKMVARIEASQE